MCEDREISAMNVTLGFVLLILLTLSPTTTMAQELELNLLFSESHNDHFKKKFHVKERMWRLKKGVLHYSIDGQSIRYTDRFSLKAKDVRLLHTWIMQHKLTQSIHKNLNQTYLNKRGYQFLIKGKIKLKKQVSQFYIKANGVLKIREDPDAQKLQKLENLLHTIIKTYHR